MPDVPMFEGILRGEGVYEDDLVIRLFRDSEVQMSPPALYPRIRSRAREAAEPRGHADEQHRHREAEDLPAVPSVGIARSRPLEAAGIECVELIHDVVTVFPRDDTGQQAPPPGGRGL